MIRILLNDGLAPKAVVVGPGWRLPEGAIWLDLLAPTREEEVAARIVNKQRAEHGETKDAKKK